MVLVLSSPVGAVVGWVVVVGFAVVSSSLSLPPLLLLLLLALPLLLLLLRSDSVDTAVFRCFA